MSHCNFSISSLVCLWLIVVFSFFYLLITSSNAIESTRNVISYFVVTAHPPGAVLVSSTQHNHSVAQLVGRLLMSILNVVVLFYIYMMVY
jgi:hypothetical protein